MRTADLITDELYAYTIGRNSSFAQKVKVLNTTTMYRHMPDGTFVPTTARATAGRYYRGAVGVLIDFVDVTGGRRDVVPPARLQCTWPEWEARRAAEKAAQIKASEQRLETKHLAADQAATIEALAAQAGVSLPYISTHELTHRVSGSTLIQLLQLAVQAREKESA